VGAAGDTVDVPVGEVDVVRVGDVGLEGAGRVVVVDVGRVGDEGVGLVVVVVVVARVGDDAGAGRVGFVGRVGAGLVVVVARVGEGSGAGRVGVVDPPRVTEPLVAGSGASVVVVTRVVVDVVTRASEESCPTTS
jgi:hypothetical protein